MIEVTIDPTAFSVGTLSWWNIFPPRCRSWNSPYSNVNLLTKEFGDNKISGCFSNSRSMMWFFTGKVSRMWWSEFFWWMRSKGWWLPLRTLNFQPFSCAYILCIYRNQALRSSWSVISLIPLKVGFLVGRSKSPKKLVKLAGRSTSPFSIGHTLKSSPNGPKTQLPMKNSQIQQ